jgi:hypothetical protein
MEDDDGFVFKRPTKQQQRKDKPSEIPIEKPVSKSKSTSKPYIDFVNVKVN